MNKRWKKLQAGEDAVNSLHEALKINTVLCKILAQRGIDDFEKSKAFFRPQLSSLYDPYLMKDMGLAVSRITTAINQKEKISSLVILDY